MLSQLKATNSYARTEEIEKELLEQKDMIIEKERIIVGLLEEKSQLKQKLDDETEKVSLLQLEIETLNKQIQKWKIQAISQE